MRKKLVLDLVVAVVAVVLGGAWLLSPPAEFPDRLAKLQESETSVNNSYYNLPEFAAQFRNRNGTGLGGLFRLNDVRIPYFEKIWTREVGKKGAFLDVGCGGGIATNALAKLGFENIEGVDIAENALAVARAEARAMGLNEITYAVGSCYAIPAADASKDGVLMSDVLEHFHDLRRAVAEVSRVLKPGGVFLLDTINRTPLSWVGAILIAERLAGYVEPGTHDWRMFITPNEIATLLNDTGFLLGPTDDLIGFRPANPFSSVPTFVTSGSDTSGAYLWWAKKKIM